MSRKILIAVFGITGVLVRAQRNEVVEKDREASRGFRRFALRRETNRVVWNTILSVQI